MKVYGRLLKSTLVAATMYAEMKLSSSDSILSQIYFTPVKDGLLVRATNGYHMFGRKLLNTEHACELFTTSFSLRQEDAISISSFIRAVNDKDYVTLSLDEDETHLIIEEFDKSMTCDIFKNPDPSFKEMLNKFKESTIHTMPDKVRFPADEFSNAGRAFSYHGDSLPFRVTFHKIDGYDINRRHVKDHFAFLLSGECYGVFKQYIAFTSLCN